MNPPSATDLPVSEAWARPVDEVLDALGSRRVGLSHDEAAASLERWGPNDLGPERRVSPWRIALRQFQSPLIYILLVAGIVTLLIREYIDAGFIGAVLVINAVIGFLQEFQAERSIAALRALARARATVMRDHRQHELDATLLVPGDVLLLEAGARIGADARLIEAHGLEVDESLLTGESGSVAKSARHVSTDAPVADRAAMVWMGTTCTRGRARAVVTATGRRTELGRIAGAMESIEEVATPLQGRIARFARIVGIAVLASAAIGMLFGLLGGEPLGSLFLAVVALAVSAVPEGLPIVLTVALAVSVRRMAARRALVRRLPAVETLGSCSAIGSDKTGTLTENRMTVVRVHAGGLDYAVGGVGYVVDGTFTTDSGPVEPAHRPALEQTLLAGVLNNDATIHPVDGGAEVSGDPTEAALLVAGAKAGLFREDLERTYPRVAEIPFDPERRYSVTFHRHRGRDLAFVKGAPEAVLDLCQTDAGGGPLDRDAILQTTARLAADGLRVLAMATKDVGPADAVELPIRPTGCHLVGLQAMFDPPRPEVRAAIDGCREAGIKVVMITGDHSVTARSIAVQLGLAEAGAPALTGRDLDRLDDAALREAISGAPVFARVSPEHKLRIVQGLQGLGHIVAVTGDGVNDAPALKAADIGVAMGRSGTDVAKEASDMIITDDNFASIFAAVREGRVAFDNVRKATFFLVSSGVGEIITVLASLLFRFPLPFLPAQLLWLNLVTNGVQDVALAFEPAEGDVLRLRPRPRSEGIMSRLLWERTALSGLVMAAGTLGLFLLELQSGSSEAHARTVALTTMVLFQVFHVGNSRSERRSTFALSPFSNRFLLVGTSAALLLHVAALYLPPFQFVLRTEPLLLADWLRSAAVAASIIVAVELHKLVRRTG